MVLSPEPEGDSHSDCEDEEQGKDVPKRAHDDQGEARNCKHGDARQYSRAER